MEQTAGVERIVKQFMEQMDSSLGVNFRQLGYTLRDTGKAQVAYTETSRELVDATTALLEVNRNVQTTLVQMMERQEEFSKELKTQRETLAATCNDIGNQLYAFDQMRNLYEK